MMMALPNRVQYLSTAPNPEVSREQRRLQEEESRKLEKSRHEFQRRNAARNNQLRMSAVITIFFMASSLFVTIYRSGIIYNMQNEYVRMQNDTRATYKNNEALKAELIKASSIGDIAEKSIALELVESDREKSLVIDLSKNNFLEEEPVVEQLSFTDKIFSMLNLNIAD
jgi:cell division protein FtsL